MRINSIISLVSITASLLAGGWECASGAHIKPDNGAKGGTDEERDASGSEAPERLARRSDPSAPNSGMVEMKVVDVGEGPGPGAAVVLLQERHGEQRFVPMVIGDFEAGAISLRLLRQQTVRPLTHNLLEAILAEYDIRIIKLEIDALKDNIFLGRLYMQDGKGAGAEIDTRPSDGIALALGAEAPIFMSIDVVNSVGRTRNERQQDNTLLEDEPEDEAPATL